MPCTVVEFVRECVVILDEKASVAEGVRSMAERNTGSVIVTCAGEVVGLFTEQDLVRRVTARGLNPAEVPLGEVCSRQLISVSTTASCREAVLKMFANHCRRLLVYYENTFIGVLELPDIAHTVATQAHRRDWLPNIIVGLTLFLVVVVIVLLIFQLPAMVHIVQRTTGG